MKAMKILNVKPLLPAIFAVLAVSCVKDTGKQQVAYGPEETVLLSIDVPVAADGGTRALANGDAECAISAVDVLQFAADGTFAYRAVGYGITGTGGTHSFEARLLTGTYSLVIIANGRTQVNDAVNGTNGVTRWEAGVTTMQTALDRVCVKLSANDKLTSGGIMPSLPMFGYVTGTNIQAGFRLTGSDAVQMVRATAKIEVNLTSKAASGTDGGTGNANFRLSGAWLYNQPLNGWIVPDMSAWNTATNVAVSPYYGGNTAPTKASYPTDAAVAYSGAADNVTDNNILRSIYTFEAPAGTGAKPGRYNNTCLVVGGYYDGSSTASYYRADIRTLSGSVETYVPLLRNHSYKVNIRSVTGIGYPLADDAFYGEMTMMEADVEYWNEMGQGVIADEPYNLTVSHGKCLFDYAGGGITVTAATDYNISSQGYPSGLQFDDTHIVYKTSDTGWVKITDGGADGDLSRTIGIEADPNVTGADRSAEIYISAGNTTKTIYIVQPGIKGMTPIGDRTYVGAFWRADQIGERLIKIPVASGSEGAWSVRVYDYGGDFAEGDILFSSRGSYDPDIYTNNTADMIANDAVYTVEDDEATYLKGNGVVGGNIFFRLGLASKWSVNAAYNSDNKPARYAVLMVSYNDYTKHQKIYLRQGHEADYLFCPNDYGRNGYYVKKFSPYNLTAEGVSDTDYYKRIYKRGTTTDGDAASAFSEYPSQAGAFFQWAGASGYERRAWHPTETITSTWPLLYASTWVEAIHETCPEGYRRPIATDGTYATSDCANSLLADITISGPLPVNTSWGYLADGFFDRRPIVSSVSGVANSMVEASSWNAAYQGMLFFSNKEGGLRQNASIFFPASGIRNNSNGGLNGDGSYVLVWSSSPAGADSGSNLFAYSTNVYPAHSYYRTNGFSVRCVKN